MIVDDTGFHSATVPQPPRHVLESAPDHLASEIRVTCEFGLERVLDGVAVLVAARAAGGGPPSPAPGGVPRRQP